MRTILQVAVVLLLVASAQAEKPKKLGFDPKKVVEAYLKENVNDAERLQIVKAEKPVSLASVYVFHGEGRGTGWHLDEYRKLGWFFQPVETEGVAILVKFRATNGLGALVLTSQVFLIDNGGNVFETVAPEDFRIGKPVEKNDPAVDAILELDTELNGPRRPKRK